MPVKFSKPRSQVTALLFLTVVTLMTCEVWAVKGASPYHVRFEDVVAEIEAGSRDASQGPHILESLFRDPDHLPGFIQIGEASKHEVANAREFGRMLFERFKVTVVLIAGIDGVQVPGYDGLVLDARGRPFANLSFKSVYRPDGNLMLEKSTKAFAKMDEFASAERWALYIISRSEWNRSFSSKGRKDKFTFNHADSYAEFRRGVEGGVLFASMFGLGTNRPQWLVTHIVNDELLTNADYERLAPMTAGRPRGADRMHMLTNREGVMTMEQGLLKLELGLGCARALVDAE